MTAPIPPSPPGLPPSGPGVRSTTSALAITSLVLGIVWICGVGSIAGLVLGIIALRQIDQAPATAPIEGKGMAIAGTVLGAIGTILLAVFLALAVVGAVAGDDDISNYEFDIGDTDYADCLSDPYTTWEECQAYR